MAELPRYNKILLATDGSEQADLAAGHALALAGATGAELTALYVVDTHLTYRLGIHRDEAIRELKQDGQQALEVIAQRAREAGLTIVCHIGEGRPGEVIVHEAQRLSADLLVMGSQGQGRMSDILLGSVSQHVLHTIRIPTLIVPPARR